MLIWSESHITGDRPMATRVIISTLTLALCVSQPSEAALYEFTLEGIVTIALGGPADGEPCIIRYVADNVDVEPDPRYGAFLVTPPRVTFPVSNVILNFEPAESMHLFVNNANMSGTGIDFISYQSLGVSPAWNLDVRLIFPDGILQSDVLPLELNLEDASRAHFSLSPSLTDAIRGNITSYSSVPVPAPSISCMVMVIGIAHRGLKRR